MVVHSSPDFDTLILIDRNGEFRHASLVDIEEEARGVPKASVVRDPIRDSKIEAWATACKKLLNNDRHKKAEVQAAADKLNVHVSTVYRALERWRQSGELKDLPPPTRSGGRGKSRLRPGAEAIIQKHLDLYLSKTGISKRKFIMDCRLELHKAGFEVSVGTLRDRLARIPAHRVLKARKGRAAAARELDPIQGSYPNLIQPLQAVQIDHWKIDLEVVSDDRSRPIGRAWATIGICIWSRMVFGLHVGLDDPGSTPFGMMMINGMLSKSQVAEEFGFDWVNPIRGRPETIEMDNAKEFTGEMAQLACNNFNINLKIRPVTKPQYGQYIERYNSTLASRFKDLPGATGSNTTERKDKSPEKTAALTLNDLTKYLWLLVDQYHNEVHSSIGMTPLEKFKSYYFGPNGQKERLPETFIDDLDFRLNWYPVTYRTIQRYGIQIDHLQYYSESIEWLVQNRNDFGTVQVRRNPFDVRVIYIQHPAPDLEAIEADTLESKNTGSKNWVPVYIRQISFPEASISDYREAKREALRRSREYTPENLAAIIENQQDVVETAQKLTKEAQRNAAKRNHHRKENKKASEAQRRTTGQRPNGEPAHGPDASNLNDYELSAILAGISDDDVENLVK